MHPSWGDLDKIGTHGVLLRNLARGGRQLACDTLRPFALGPTRRTRYVPRWAMAVFNIVERCTEWGGHGLVRLERCRTYCWWAQQQPDVLDAVRVLDTARAVGGATAADALAGYESSRAALCGDSHSAFVEVLRVLLKADGVHGADTNFAMLIAEAQIRLVELVKNTPPGKRPDDVQLFADLLKRVQEAAALAIVRLAELDTTPGTTAASLLRMMAMGNGVFPRVTGKSEVLRQLVQGQRLDLMVIDDLADAVDRNDDRVHALAYAMGAVTNAAAASVNVATTRMTGVLEDYQRKLGAVPLPSPRMVLGVDLAISKKNPK